MNGLLLLRLFPLSCVPSLYIHTQTYTTLFLGKLRVSCIHEPLSCGASEGQVSAYGLDQGSIPGSGKSPGEGNGNPLQYSCLENPMDGEAWWATVHGVTKSRTQLSDFTFHFHIKALYRPLKKALEKCASKKQNIF